MKRAFKHLFYICVLASCVTPFDVNTSKVTGQIVISGRITNLKEQEPILIQATSTSGIRPPISGAIVKVIEDKENEIQLNELSPGKYYFPPNMIGTPGRIYELIVNFVDGRSYQSKPQMMPNANGRGRPTFRLAEKNTADAEGTVRKTPIIKVITDADLDRSGLYMKWDVYETYYLSPTNFPDPFNTIPPPCFVTNFVNKQNLTLLNGQNILKTSFTNFQVTEREIDKTFAEKHMFSVYQISMTREAFEYWRKVQLLLNQAGSIFDTPPGPIEGNIYNSKRNEDTVLGFFEVSNIVISRFAVFPSDIPFLISQPCTYIPEKPEEFYSRECIDCLSLPNSTYTQPDWFID